MTAIFGRFSRQSEGVLIEAQNIAQRLGRPVQSDVVLLAMLAQSSAPATELLKHLGASYTKLFEQLPPLPSPHEAPAPGQTQEMQTLLEESIRLAGRFRFSLVELEHLLYIIARDEHFIGHQVLKQAGIEPNAIVNRLNEWLMSVSAMASHQRRIPQPASEESSGREDEGELERYTLDLTDLAASGELDPVIGRERELEQLIHILLRRRKNNPLLIGEPGVGKTALVDGLAQRIARRQVPRPLLGKRVLNLDLSQIVAGTMYRGQFEERLKNIIQEVISLGDCILFIDEIHTLSGTGSSEGGFDAANILKPALARGEISLIGATTYEEYRKHIRKDKALDRRFQTVTVNEPTTKEATQMLKGIKGELELHHEVAVTDEAVRSAVELSVRYIHDRFLPDKAIDILDEAATYHAEEAEDDSRLTALQQEISLVSTQKAEVVERASTPEEWEYAKALSEKESQLMHTLQQLQAAERRQRTRQKVTSTEVVQVVAKRTGIPIEQIAQTLQPLDVRRLKGVLEKHILGQDVALSTISKALLRAQLGLQPSKKPIGSFLLVGPTGVGKTETARILAEQVFGDAAALIKIDMSEYMERHTVSNLIGAPAGYIGYDQGGSLTEQVWRRPYSVILFDEVEKAHPDVFNILLQILEDGMLTDNTGRTTNFEHAIIILTSNIGLESFNQAAKIGFTVMQDSKEAARQREREELEEHIQREIQDYFRPELLGRLSATIFYQPLTEQVVNKLIRRRFSDLKAKVKPRGVALEASDSLFKWLVEQYDPEAGARSIDKIFLHTLEPVLIDALMRNVGCKQLLLDVKDDTIVAEAPQTTTSSNPTSTPPPTSKRRRSQS